MISSITKTMCAAALIGLVASETSAGPMYGLSWYSIDGGGGTSSNGALQLHSVIGQADASAPAAMSGGNFSLTGGFLVIYDASTCPADLTDSDSNMPDGVIDVFDLLELLTNWGTNAPGAGIAAPFDVVDVFDLLELLAMWGPCE